MKNLTLTFCLVGSTVLFAASCGGVSSTDGADASVTPMADAMVVPDAMPPDPCTLDEIPGEAFSECYARSICEFVVNCQFQTDDLDECLAALQTDPLSFQLKQSQDAIAAGKLDVDGDVAKECFDNFAECVSFSTACDRMLVGQTPQNGDCVNDIECGIGGDCEIAAPVDECKIGVCQIPLREGQSCEGGLACEAGLRCLGPVGALICSAGNVGDFCTNDFNCSDVNRCNVGASVCEPRAAENGACADASDCLQPLSCVANVCMRPDAVGDACDTNCVGPFVCRANVCAALPTVGEACPENSCANEFSADCVGGVCVARAKEGESCAAVSCEFGLECEAGAQVCQPRTANGGTCADDSECAEFNCSAANVCEEFETCY